MDSDKVARFHELALVHNLIFKNWQPELGQAYLFDLGSGPLHARPAPEKVAKLVELAAACGEQANLLKLVTARQDRELFIAGKLQLLYWPALKGSDPKKWLSLESLLSEQNLLPQSTEISKTAAEPASSSNAETKSKPTSHNASKQTTKPAGLRDLQFSANHTILEIDVDQADKSTFEVDVDYTNRKLVLKLYTPLGWTAGSPKILYDMWTTADVKHIPPAVPGQPSCWEQAFRLLVSLNEGKLHVKCVNQKLARQSEFNIIVRAHDNGLLTYP